MSQGICVVDAELRLVAWNSRYAGLFDYPPELLQVGRPVADLTRYAVTLGMVGEVFDGTRARPRASPAARTCAPAPSTCPNDVFRTARWWRSAATRCPVAASWPPSPTSPRSARPRPRSSASTKRWSSAWTSAPARWPQPPARRSAPTRRRAASSPR